MATHSPIKSARPPRHHQGDERPRRGVGPWPWIAGLVALLFGGCFGIYALGARSSAARADQEKRDFERLPAISVTPEALVAAYAHDKLAADEKYRDKKLVISGRVDAVEPGVGEGPVVRLKGGDLFHPISARGVPKDALARLQKGATITIVCKGDGAISGSPMLRDCNPQ